MRLPDYHQCSAIHSGAPRESRQGKTEICFDAEGIGMPYPQQDVHLYLQDTPTSRAMAHSGVSQTSVERA
jgi:hypothetical protein